MVGGIEFGSRMVYDEEDGEMVGVKSKETESSELGKFERWLGGVCE